MRFASGGAPLAAVWFPVFLATVSAIPAGAQAASSRDLSNPRFNVDSTLVLIPATVTDRMNRFVLGLKQQDFHLLEDGAEQAIAHFSGEDVPLSIGLVFDTSGSMADKLRTSREAAVEFLKTMNPEDEAFLVEFNEHATLAAGFTSHVEEIENKLASVQPGGLTAMLDAAELALHEMKKARNPRKAVLIISDGGDAMGVFEPTIFLPLTKEEVSGPRLLSELAEQTGGRAFSASSAEDLPSVAARIGIELRNQYVLAYSPKNQTKDGKYRHVDVKLTKPAGIPDVKVRWRSGYYAPSE